MAAAMIGALTPLLGQPSAILLQKVALLTDCRTLCLDVTLYRDDLFASTIVGLDQLGSPLGYLLLKLGHLLVLSCLLTGMFLGHLGKPLVPIAAAHPDDKPEQDRHTHRLVYSHRFSSALVDARVFAAALAAADVP